MTPLQAIHIVSSAVIDGSLWLCTKKWQIAAAALASQVFWPLVEPLVTTTCILWDVAVLSLMINIVILCSTLSCINTGITTTHAYVWRMTGALFIVLGPVAWPLTLCVLEASTSSPLAHMLLEAAALGIGAAAIARKSTQNPSRVCRA